MINMENENISEYIIRIYRSEDLVRAFEFDLEKIGTHVINHLPISNIDKLSHVNFYEDLIQKMKEQKLESNGHISEINDLVHELEKLHGSLLDSDLNYKKILSDAIPYIEDNIKASEGSIKSEIQICLNGIYGFLLLKLNGKNIDDSLQTMVEHFGNVLSYLSVKYKEATQSN